MNKIILDGSAWIEYLAGTSKGRKVQNLIQKPDTKVFTTGMITAEVITKHLKEGQPIDNSLAALRAISFLVHVDLQVGERTAQVYIQQRKKKPRFGLVDAHVYAAGRAVDATVVTCNFDFSGLSNTMTIQ